MISELALQRVVLVNFDLQWPRSKPANFQTLTQICQGGFVIAFRCHDHLQHAITSDSNMR